MAVELETFLTDQLARLPADHPDRSFLTGLRQAVAAYTEQVSHDTIAQAQEVLEDYRGRFDDDVGSVTEQARESVHTAAEATDTGQAEQARVTLKGRMGGRVRFSTTPRGVRRAEFNLAVHEDDESTTWHRVLAFRQRAEALEQANPQKGQVADVIGYRHVEERTDRDGNAKTVERIVAAHIRLR